MRVLGPSSLWLPAAASFLMCVALLGACSEAAPAQNPESSEPEVAPSDPLEGLEPWSDAWILAHAPAYLDDVQARRAGLEASLLNEENLYARTRLGAYGRGNAGWDALPEWNPRTAPMSGARAAAFQRGEGLSLEGLVPMWDGEQPTTWEGWRQLGRSVFYELPLRSEPFWEVALRSPERGEELGVERAEDGSVPGLVVLRDIDGRAKVGITCALCHAARVPGSSTVVEGRGRRTLDYGALRLAYFEAHGQEVDPDVRRRWESWGPGRADVLEDIVETPIAIPDLYGLRNERLLTQAGTIRQRSPMALLARQETQYIQANHHHTRPPRALVFALAVYLYALEPPAPRAPVGAPEVRARGAEVFAAECVSCHENAAGAGDRLIETGMIRTDDELANGAARGTGGYRPSPLIRVRDAGPYLHHGAVGTLLSLLSAERLAEDYADGPAGPGPVLGHTYGHDLSESDRLALLAHLTTF